MVNSNSGEQREFFDKRIARSIQFNLEPITSGVVLGRCRVKSVAVTSRRIDLSLSFLFPFLHQPAIQARF